MSETIGISEIKFTRPIREALGPRLEIYKKKIAKRPPNAFILFRIAYTRELNSQKRYLKANEISRLSSEHWKTLSDENRHEFEQISKELRNALSNNLSKKPTRIKPGYKWKSMTPNLLAEKPPKKFSNSSKPKDSNDKKTNNSKDITKQNFTLSNGKSKATYITDNVSIIEKVYKIDNPTNNIIKNLSTNLDISDITAEIIPEHFSYREFSYQQNLSASTPPPPFNNRQLLPYQFENSMYLNQSHINVNDDDMYYDEDQMSHEEHIILRMEYDHLVSLGYDIDIDIDII
ncbi:1172_t:CDS:1 [Ambispora gerdemannii]|uniref:1172_t:CDS:1 n=1 Tax=Ambispora gerdemannii TaxID=144530 RepID=A0A9N9ACL2_9GLOM|nr:1172_t:CDS:1 [Ambispora gerdemannii]